MLAHRFDMIKGQVRVEPLYLAPNRVDHALRFDAGVDDERHITVVFARHREVEEGPRVFAKSPVLAGFHDANDFKARVIRPATAQAFADRILPGPEATRESFV